MAVNFSNISGILTSLGHPILNGCQLFNHLWYIPPCMTVSFPTIAGTTYPPWLWLSAFQAFLGHPFLHGCDMAANFSILSGILILHGGELFKHLWTYYLTWLWAFQPSLEQPILNGCQLSKHLEYLSCMAVSFSIISGTTLRFWSILGHLILQACELYRHLWAILSCMAVSFSSISEILILHGCELCKHLWGALSCMAVSFSNISGTTLSFWSISGASFLHGSAMAVNFSNISGIHILHGCQLFKHLSDIQSWMAVSFSSNSGTSYILHGCELLHGVCYILSAWLSTFQASLEHPALPGCELSTIFGPSLSFWGTSAASYLAWLHMAVKFLSTSPILTLHGCDMAVNFSNISEIRTLNGCQLFKHLDILSCMAVSFSAIPGTTLGF